MSDEPLYWVVSPSPPGRTRSRYINRADADEAARADHRCQVMRCAPIDELQWHDPDYYYKEVWVVLSERWGISAEEAKTALYLDDFRREVFLATKRKPQS